MAEIRVPFRVGVAFAPDGLTVLVQNMVQKNIQVFRIDGMRLVDTGQRIPLRGGGATRWRS